MKVLNLIALTATLATASLSYALDCKQSSSVDGKSYRIEFTANLQGVDIYQETANGSQLINKIRCSPVRTAPGFDPRQPQPVSQTIVMCSNSMGDRGSNVIVNLDHITKKYTAELSRTTFIGRITTADFECTK